MMIFVKKGENLMAIPYNRVVLISQDRYQIKIYYQGGIDYTEYADSGFSKTTKYEVVTLTYESTDAATQKFREFYRACDKKAAVFMFSAESKLKSAKVVDTDPNGETNEGN